MTQSDPEDKAIYRPYDNMYGKLQALVSSLAELQMPIWVLTSSADRVSCIEGKK